MIYFSLGLNVILLLFVMVFVYRRRGRIMRKLGISRGEATAPSADILAQFNDRPVEVVNESLIIDKSLKTVSILFLGNSITKHPVIDDFYPCMVERGMMATVPEKDYVHQLVKMIADAQHVNVNFSIANIAEFERGFLYRPFSLQKISNAREKAPDILIVQIGENVDGAQLENPAKFEKEYLHLLSFFPNSMRIVTLPFWPDKRKQYAITDVAIRSKSFLVDLGHLGDSNDPENFASSQKEYKKPGVGEHPGDVGMKRIADCYFAIINASRRD